ncbi:DUF1428 domain-containing protein [Roseibacillus persicicus]|uniref:DUF1428 domain-containing protein n=1 Tax=Roseibacillus persicicus TaxID=454148 RepID=UPI00398A782F
MSQYIDGFIIPVPKDKIEDYLAAAQQSAVVWKEHGALEYRECVGDDLEVEDQIPFPRLANANPDETVVFAYAVFASKEARDEANKKIMTDPRLEKMCEEVGKIFDFKRMAYGGFESRVHE